MDKRPIVLFTASTCSHILNFHLPYLKEFHRLGWDVHVACGGPMNPIPEADRIITLPFEKKMSSPNNFISSHILKREIKNNEYTLITTHTSLAAFFTRLALMGIKNQPPLINVVHGYLFDDKTPVLRRKLLVAAEKLTSNQTDLILAMNEWDYSFALKKNLSSNIELISGIGVDFERLDVKKHPEELRKEMGFSNEDFLLIYAAEFSDRKNQSMLIKALSRLPERVKLLLPGDGKLREDCKKLARLLGVEKRVIIPGYVSDMPSWFSAANAAVSSSQSEGLPFNVMEAMYFGLPIVASRVKGHTDLIEDGENGILYPLGDENAFVKAINALIDSKELARELGNAANRTINRFSITEVMPKVMEKYFSILNSNEVNKKKTKLTTMKIDQPQQVIGQFDYLEYVRK